MVSEEKTDRSEEATYFLPHRQYRRGPLPAGPIYRPSRGDDTPDPEPAEELAPDSKLWGRQWRRGPLSDADVAPPRVNALWLKRHGADE